MEGDSANLRKLPRGCLQGTQKLKNRFGDLLFQKNRGQHHQLPSIGEEIQVGSIFFSGFYALADSLHSQITRGSRDRSFCQIH